MHANDSGQLRMGSDPTLLSHRRTCHEADRRIATLLALASAPALANEVIDSTGAQNFDRFCSACHGAGGKGDGPVAAALVGGAPDLTKIAARRDGQFRAT